MWQLEHGFKVPGNQHKKETLGPQNCCYLVEEGHCSTRDMLIDLGVMGSRALGSMTWGGQ